jgi:hypothetical protein
MRETGLLVEHLLREGHQEQSAVGPLRLELATSLVNHICEHHVPDRLDRNFDVTHQVPDTLRDNFTLLQELLVRKLPEHTQPSVPSVRPEPVTATRTRVIGCGLSAAGHRLRAIGAGHRLRGPLVVGQDTQPEVRRLKSIGCGLSAAGHLLRAKLPRPIFPSLSSFGTSLRRFPGHQMPESGCSSHVFGAHLHPFALNMDLRVLGRTVLAESPEALAAARRSRSTRYTSTEKQLNKQ